MQSEEKKRITILLQLGGSSYRGGILDTLRVLYLRRETCRHCHQASRVLSQVDDTHGGAPRACDGGACARMNDPCSAGYPRALCHVDGAASLAPEGIEDGGIIWAG